MGDAIERSGRIFVALRQGGARRRRSRARHVLGGCKTYRLSLVTAEAVSRGVTPEDLTLTVDA